MTRITAAYGRVPPPRKACARIKTQQRYAAHSALFASAPAPQPEPTLPNTRIASRVSAGYALRLEDFDERRSCRSRRYPAPQYVSEGDQRSCDAPLRDGPGGIGSRAFGFGELPAGCSTCEPGETRLPASIQRAFDQAVKVREVIRKTARAGKTAKAMMDDVNTAISAAGFTQMQGFNQVRSDASTEFIIGCHSVGDWGHGIGPSMAWFNPGRMNFEIRPTNLFSIELFAYTPLPEWGGKKLRIPLEDDAVVTSRGVEWLSPINHRVQLIR